MTFGASKFVDPMPVTLPRQLENSIAAFPDRIAVEDLRELTSITYRELGIRVKTIRGALASAGIGRGDRIGIYSPKSASVVAAIHGILAAGAAYVPVDAFAPPARSAGILEDCRVRAVVVAEHLLDTLVEALSPRSVKTRASLGGGLLLVDTTEDTTIRDLPGDHVECEPSDIAYILYTSGSTGRPKGVVHTHRSAVSFVDWCSQTFAPRESDRFSSHAPFHFDLSILDLFLSAKHGSTVVIIDEDAGKQPQGLAALMAERQLTIWYSTPSTLRLLTRFGRLPRHDLSSLRLVLFAGEVFPPSPLRELVSLLPDARFYNLYGPTETNVCTYFEIPAEIDSARTTPFPIGRSCENDRTRVVDPSGEDVAAGHEGELYVSGGSVMSGYWNAGEVSSDAFVTDHHGAAWYPTGDLVRETERDGYVFLGRRDRMVKRRGYRVELGEIESALSAHPQISHAAVTALPDDESGVRLEASLVANGENKLSIIALKQYCLENLPVYMVPDRFRFLDSIPQTSTGKTDYQKLLGMST